jgi:hypothetical protein
MVFIFEKVDYVRGTGAATDVKQEEGLPLQRMEGGAEESSSVLFGEVFRAGAKEFLIVYHREAIFEG